MRFFGPLSLFVAAFFVPLIASAHEVYVLDKASIARDIMSASPNPFDIIPTNQYQFFLWGFIAVVVVSTVFFMSITHWLEELCFSVLQRIKPWAPLVARVTLGVSLIASGYNSALFGPEIPVDTLLGPQYSIFFTSALYVSGVFILFGLFTRTAALAALVVFVVGIFSYQTYMITYANYLGEILVVLLLGGGRWSVDSYLVGTTAKRLSALEPYAFLMLRVLFGISVAFAAFYAKYLHSDLALDTIVKYNLTSFFHFEPLFIVLGACIIEILIGIFFAFGFEIRHTSLFFLFWITLSLFYFGESVWPHLILIGVNLALFMYGYDRFTVQGRFFSRGKYEPVL